MQGTVFRVIDGPMKRQRQHVCSFEEAVRSVEGKVECGPKRRGLNSHLVPQPIDQENRAPRVVVPGVVALPKPREYLGQELEGEVVDWSTSRVLVASFSEQATSIRSVEPTPPQIREGDAIRCQAISYLMCAPTIPELSGVET